MDVSLKDNSKENKYQIKYDSHCPIHTQNTTWNSGNKQKTYYENDNKRTFDDIIDISNNNVSPTNHTSRVEINDIASDKSTRTIKADSDMEKWT